MAEIVVRCPGCRVAIKLKAIPQGKKAFACPKCQTAVPYPKPKPEPEEEPVLEVEAADDDEEQEDEVEDTPPPRSRKRRPRDDEEDDDEEDEDDRPRRRKKKKQPPVVRGYLWPVGLGGSLLIAALVFAFFFLLMGTKGFPDPEEGPVIIKYVVLVFMLLVATGVIINGTYGIVYQKITVARKALVVMWSETYEGSMAVLVGAGQCIAGSIIFGAALYGLVF